ncbi:hypothetical protein NL676_039818 [Syzygium grande]|nr:hypothetical protein NL676_039818 [Syzygium grande]
MKMGQSVTVTTNTEKKTRGGNPRCSRSSSVGSFKKGEVEGNNTTPKFNSRSSDIDVPTAADHVSLCLSSL